MKRFFSLFLALVMLVTAIPFAAMTASAADVLKGDVDGNGQVTAIDARYILRHVAGLLEGDEVLDERALDAADMDKNDEVTAIDARFVLRQVAGLSNGIYEVDTD